MKRKKAQKPVARADIDAYLLSRAGLERVVLDQILSKARAWKRVGFAGLGIGVICVIAASLVFFRAKVPAPDWVWVVNGDTGVPHRVSTIVETDTRSERQDAYWVTQFVRHYESYEWNTIQSDWNAVGLMAVPDVAARYQERVKSGEQALLDTLKERYQIRVNIVATIVDTATQIATVRYTTIRHNNRDNYDEPARHWVAKIGYDYRNIPANVEERTINPFGFRVKSFRRYQEGD